MSEARLENLVDELAAELMPVKPIGCLLRRTLLWLAGAALYIGALVFAFGLRPDIDVALHDMLFLFESGLAGALSVSAAIAAAWLSVPDMRGRGWAAMPALALTGIFLLWIAARSGVEGINIPHDGWHLCATRAFLYGLPPGAAMVWMSRQGATVRPYLTGLMNALAAGAAGWLGLRYTCPSEDTEHIFFYHFMPYAVLGIVVTALARKLYRW